MSYILRFLSAILFIWLFRRFLGLIFGTSQKPAPANSSPDTANHMVKDPICGMYMDSRLAVRLDDRSEAAYFCSEECKSKYLNKATGERIGSSAAM